MILKPEDVRKIRPIAENLNDPARLETYLRESETLRLVDAIGAGLYRWLDETDFSGEGPFEYLAPGNKPVSITKDQYTTLMDGGYYPADCSCDCSDLCRTEGLISAIAYTAYARFVMNNPINSTAFGVVMKNGEFSTPVNDSILVRNSSEARKIGEAYLNGVVSHLRALELLPCCKTYKESPRKNIRIHRDKL